jgi:hypothetical protein
MGKEIPVQAFSGGCVASKQNVNWSLERSRFAQTSPNNSHVERFIDFAESIEIGQCSKILYNYKSFWNPGSAIFGKILLQ